MAPLNLGGMGLQGSKMLARGHNLRLRDEGASWGGRSTQDAKTRTVSTCSVNPGGLCLNYPPERFRESVGSSEFGVGADGVGVKFPIFPVNCSRLPLSRRIGEKKNKEKRRKAKKSEEKNEKENEKKRRKTKKKNEKNGKVPPTPSTPTPLRTSQGKRWEL